MRRIFLRANAKLEAGQYWPGLPGRLAKDDDVGIVLERYSRRVPGPVT